MNDAKKEKMLLSAQKVNARAEAEIIHAKKHAVRDARKVVDDLKAKLTKEKEAVRKRGIKLAAAELVYRNAVTALMPEHLRD